MQHSLYSDVISETLGLVYFIYLIHGGNRTEWSPIWSVIIQVINKIGQPLSGSANHEYDYQQNWTLNTKSCYQSIITITISSLTSCGSSALSEAFDLLQF